MSSRTQVAEQVANVLRSGGDRSHILAEVAAWLQINGKTRQASYIIQDVKQSLAGSGYLFATITSVRPLSAQTKKSLELYLLSLDGITQIECEYQINKDLIGGVCIDTPIGMLDASVRARLAKIVEGVSR